MEATYPTIVDTVTNLICKTKGVKKEVVLKKDNLQALGFDQLDVVNLILALEKKYQITIPDEVPVESVRGIAHFVHDHAA